MRRPLPPDCRRLARATLAASTIVAACASARQTPAPSQGSNAKAAANTAARAERGAPLAAGLTASDGAEIRVFAESPQLYNPSAIDVDPRGRVWVSEAVNYRQWDGRNPGRHHEAGDRIVVLGDADADGRCDSSVVFAQDKDLVAPLGILWLPASSELGPKAQQALVSCSPTAWLYTDLDGDDVADKREVFLTGFGGHDHDHGLHSFVLGPDGKLYGAVGNAGPHIVTDKRGFTLRSGSIYRDGGAEPADNKPNLVSDDGRVWTGGLILRVERDGTGLTVMAHNFRNQYEVALDAFGQMYTADNDDDGNGGCRATWVLPGGNYGFFGRGGASMWQADRRPGQSALDAHWHQADPGVCPMGTITGPGAPTGLTVYEGQLFGSAFAGRVLQCDAGAGVVFAHQVLADGSGYALELQRWITAERESADAHARDFRPSDVAVGPQGEVYVADWSDPVSGGHAAYDQAAYGRILVLRPPGVRPSAPPPVALDTAPARLAALASPCASVRALAQQALSALAEPARLAMAQPDQDPRLRARIAPARLEQPNAAAQARALAEAEALRRPADRLASALAELRRPEPSWDRWRALSLAARCAEHASELLAALAPLRESQGALQRQIYWELAFHLHPADHAPLFAARVRDAAVSLAERVRALDALAFIDERAAGEAMLDLALGGAAELHERAIWWIERNREGAWHDFGLDQQLGPRGLEDAQAILMSGVLGGGEGGDTELDVSQVEELWLVVGDGGNGNSCDWADWIEPVLIGSAGEVPLTQLSPRVAEAGWGSVHFGRNCNGGPLQVDGKGFTQGIGTHAPSRIAYTLPPGIAKLRMSFGVDDGGGRQQPPQASVQFEVRVRYRQDPAQFRALEAELCDAATSAARVEELAASLCSDPKGGLRLVALAERGALPPAARESVGRQMRNHPDLAVRQLASQFFPRSAADGRALPPASEILARTGSRRRGEALFHGERAQCARCHAFDGRGADIGPELYGARAKLGREGLLDALLNPSATIAHGYDSYLVETVDGDVHAGFVLARGAELVLRETSGRRVVLPADAIASERRQSLSVMPDDIATTLSAAEIADLLAYLSSDPRAPGRRGAPLELFNGRDLAGWDFYLDDPKARAADVWSVEQGVLRCTGSPAGYLKSQARYESFELELDWRFDPARGAGNSGVLMRMSGADKIWPRSIEAQLMSRNAGDLWNIDEFPMQVASERTSGRHTEKLLPSNERPLGEWNHYRIVLDGGELALYVNGALQNRASHCEELAGALCLQSEGAHIEFRRILLTPIERD